MNRRLLFIIFCSCLGFFSLNGQTFKAQAILGLNAGQIDGDFEVGYNKIGVCTGVGIGLFVSKQAYIGTEFLFSQRGSKNSFFRKDGVNPGSIRIDYIELPLVFKYHDWYEEKDGFHRVWIEGGASLGRLIIANIKGSDMPELVEEFSSNDISLFGGAGYAITKNFKMSLRYTRSLSPFYKAENPGPLDVKSFISYFITLRASYTL